MNQHKATPERWRHIEKLSAYCVYDKAILELLDRIEAAEQRISKLEQPSPDHLRDATEMVPTDQELCAVFSDEGYGDEPIGVALRRLYDLGRRNVANSSAVLTSSNYPVIPDSSPAPAGGLVERVTEAIDPEDPPCYHVEAARAAILAVADYMGKHGWPNAAYYLREEIEADGWRK